MRTISEFVTDVTLRDLKGRLCMSVITVDLKKEYKVGDNIINAVNGVNLDIKDGSFVAIMGASGCGKTTLLHLIGGLDKATSGKVVVNGSDLSQMNDTSFSSNRFCVLLVFGSL